MWKLWRVFLPLTESCCSSSPGIVPLPSTGEKIEYMSLTGQVTKAEIVELKCQIHDHIAHRNMFRIVKDGDKKTKLTQKQKSNAPPGARTMHVMHHTIRGYFVRILPSISGLATRRSQLHIRCQLRESCAVVLFAAGTYGKKAQWGARLGKTYPFQAIICM